MGDAFTDAYSNKEEAGFNGARKRVYERLLKCLEDKTIGIATVLNAWSGMNYGYAQLQDPFYRMTEHEVKKMLFGMIEGKRAAWKYFVQNCQPCALGNFYKHDYEAQCKVFKQIMRLCPFKFRKH